jgi:hypothetical protein
MLCGFCEHGNEPLGSIKGGKSFEKRSIPSASHEGLCSVETFSSQREPCYAFHEPECLQLTHFLPMNHHSRHIIFPSFPFVRK